MEARRTLIAAASIAFALLSRAGTPQTPAPGTGGGADLSLAPADLRIEQRGDGGYRLFIRAKPGLASVLLTETTKDPAMKADNYAYRAREPNPVNAGEKRMLDGKFIEDSARIYSLIDSSPEADPSLGSAFQVFIPYVVEFGYDWTRHGEVFVANGTFVNVRCFARPYADYSGAWKDNPFRISVTQRPLPGPPEGNYLKEAVDTYRSVSEGGRMAYAEAKDLVPRIKEMVEAAKGRSLDLVVCLDSTDSMSNDIDEVRTALVPMIRSILADFPSFRVGLTLYKDYYEEYLVRRFDFAPDLEAFEGQLRGIKVRGGADIPEAVNEALYEAAVGYPWAAEKRLIILIGDAPAHPIPRGKISLADAKAAAKARGVSIDAIILPQ